MQYSLMMDENGEKWRIPELTQEQRCALEAIELANGRPLAGLTFSQLGGGKYAVTQWTKNRVLRRLIQLGLIEVMALQPAIYRVTKFGQLARRMR